MQPLSFPPSSDAVGPDTADESWKPRVSWHLPVATDKPEKRREEPPADEPPPERREVRRIEGEGIPSSRSFGSLPLRRISPFQSEERLTVEAFPRFAHEEAMAQLTRQWFSGITSGLRANARSPRPFSMPQ
jgi:hypothetical protein